MRTHLPIGDWETGEQGDEKITPIRPGIATKPRKERAPAPVVKLVRPAPSEPVCERCKGAGMLRNDAPYGHPLFATYVKCECQLEALKLEATAITYSWLGVDNSALATITFADFDPREQIWTDKATGKHHNLSATFADFLRQAQDYAARLIDGERVENVIAVGNCGTGKTLLASAALNALREKQIPCLYGRAQSLFNALYASNFDQRFVRLASTTPLLVLDEADKYYARKEDAPEPEEPRQSNYHKTTLGEIIGARYEAGLPTWLISNEQHDLSPWLDEWTLSRCLGNRRTLEMTGRDCRQKGWAT